MRKLFFHQHYFILHVKTVIKNNFVITKLDYWWNRNYLQVYTKFLIVIKETIQENHLSTR